MTVGQLSVTLGLLVDKNSWKKGDAMINHFRRVALGFGAVFGGRILGKALIGFNASVEESKNQVAAMLAFAKQTSMTDELTNANLLYDRLRKKAMELPGETQDYVQMLGMITQPLAAAGASLEDMEKFTVNSFVLSKGLGESWQKSARDIREFINFGKINMVDTFTRTVMKPLGFDADEKSRAKLRKMTAEERMRLMEQALSGPQVQQMIDAQAKSFNGRLDAVKGNLKQIMGTVGASLFESLKGTLTTLAAWLENNQATIQSWATRVGQYIAGAFEAAQMAIMWLVDHQDILVAFLAAIGANFLIMGARALIAWLAVAWPLFAGAGLFYMFTKLYKVLGPIPTILIAIGVAALAMWAGLGAPIVIAVVALAAFAAALYVWRDDVVAIFKEVAAQAGKVFKVMSYIPGISNVIGAGKAIYGLATGDAGMVARGAAQTVFGPGGALVGDAVADEGGMTSLVGNTLARVQAERVTPTRNNLRAEDFGGAPSVSINNAPTTVNITTQDVAGAKAAFQSANQDRADADARAAMRAFGGKL